MCWCARSACTLPLLAWVCGVGVFSGSFGVILAVDGHSRYIVAVPGQKLKKTDDRDKDRVGLQAKTVAQAILRHWLTVFDVPAVICRDRGRLFIGAWFSTMCKYMGVKPARTMAYRSRSNGRAEVPSRQLLKMFLQSNTEQRGRNWYRSRWKAPQASHDLPGPSGLSLHCSLFLRDLVSRTLP